MPDAPQITHVTVPVDVINKTLNYLASKPFGEVADIIAELKTTADASYALQQKAHEEQPPSTLQP